ncbi:MAG: cation transporter, partial [Thauera sp.]|nr:cation transporter [Thauera sp.]
MDVVDHGAGACCGQCGGAAPSARLQPRVVGEGEGLGHGARGALAGAAAKAGVEAALGVAPAARAGAVEARTRSVFRIPGMDCPSEEQMIRLRLADAPVAALAFDLAGRRLTVDHDGDPQAILARLVPLGYGA